MCTNGKWTKTSAIFGEDMSDVMVSKKRSLDELLDRFKSGLEVRYSSLASSNKNLLMWSHYASNIKVCA